MKAIITGGAGFIGSHLADLLVAEGHDVKIVDDLSGGRRTNIAALTEQGRVTLRKVDITQRESLAHEFIGADWVFHLAAKADIVPSIDNPDLYFQTNVAGTLNVLRAAQQAGVKRFVYSASSSCYGIPIVYPTPETAPLAPEYPYALTKIMGEELVMHWGKVYHLPVVSLRLFNVYGPRVRTNGTYGAVFGVFLAQKCRQKPFTVVGDGHQSRDFTYVTDVARAFYAAARSDRCNEIYNIGSGGHYRVSDLVALLDGPAVYIPKRPGEPDCTFADIQKVQLELGWKPQVSFETGVKTMLADLNSWYDAPLWTPENIAQATQTWFSSLHTDG